MRGKLAQLLEIGLGKIFFLCCILLALLIVARETNRTLNSSARKTAMVINKVTENCVCRL